MDMKTLISAIFATAFMTGLATAQEAPVLIGKLSANVDARYNEDNDQLSADTPDSFTFSARSDRANAMWMEQDAEGRVAIERTNTDIFTGR